MKLFIAMSAYNEEKSIPPLFDEIIQSFSDYKYPYLVVLVDDGSKDKTIEAAEAYGAKLPLKIVAHINNRGLGEGIKTAIKTVLSKANDEDIMVFLDADNTHHPEFISPMVNKVEQGYDIVIASRFRKGSKQYGVPFYRQLISIGARITFQIFLRLKGVRDYTCGFRAMRIKMLRQAYEKFGDSIITREGFACTDELLVNLISVSDKVSEVPFTLYYDKKGSISKMHLWTTIKATLKMLLQAKKH